MTCHSKGQFAPYSISVPTETLFIKQHLMIHHYTPDLWLRIFLINWNIWVFYEFNLKKIPVRENLKSCIQFVLLSKQHSQNQQKLMLKSMALGTIDTRALTPLNMGVSCCLCRLRLGNAFNSINQVFSNKQKFPKMKKKLNICRFQAVTVDTDTPGKTRRAWNTKDLIYIYMTRKNSTVAN